MTDRASNNKMLVETVAENVVSFPETVNHGNCFDHTVNLCVQATLQPFDLKKVLKVNEKEELARLSDMEQQLLNLAKGLDLDRADIELGDEDEGPDNDKGLEDETEEWFEERHTELEQQVLPICIMLMKVSF